MISKPFRGIQVNRTHPLAKGMVGCWLLNEMTGETVFDLSGNGNSGTLENGVAWGSSKFGGGLKFDGVDDYVSTQNPQDFTATDSFTFESWIKTTDSDIAARNWPRICGKNGTKYHRIGLSNNTDRKAYIHLFGTAVVIGTTTVNDGNWHHIVGVRDVVTDTVYIYVDSVEENSLTDLSGDLSEDVTFDISYVSDNKQFNGTIDDVRIYNRALSAEEVMWSYREPYAMFEPSFNPALLYSAAPPVGAIMNQFQKANIGSDLYNGAFA